MPGSVPSYRHHKPSNKAVVTLNGRDFYLGQWNSPESKDDYDRLIAEWLANHRQLPSAVTLGERSVIELADSFLDFAKGYYTKDGATTKEYLTYEALLKLVVKFYGRTLVKDFGPLALKAIRQKLIEKGLVRQSINGHIHRIRRVFRWGCENEIVPPTVVEGLRSVGPLKRGRTPAPESHKVKPVAQELIDAVLPHVSRQVAAMIRLQQLAGMRPGEVVLMRPMDIERNGDVWTYIPQRHKTEHHDLPREIYLGPRAQDALRPFLDRAVQSYCFSPAEAEAERNANRRLSRRSPMTPSQSRRQRKTHRKRPARDRYDRDSYRRAIEYGIKKAGVSHWHPHQLRHTCATTLRENHTLDVCQVVLGHSKIEATQVYAAANREKGKAVMARVG